MGPGLGSKETQAATLRWFEPLVVPALLQTEDYVRAICQTRFGLTKDDIEAQVTARLGRQRILTRNQPTALWVILDEGVLHRPVGGRHVMLDQVNHLVEAARRPSVAIEVIPASVGAHEGLGGAFCLADFNGGLSVGYQEASVGGQLLEDRDDVAALELTWSTLRGETLPRKASLAVLEEAAKSWISPA